MSDNFTHTQKQVAGANVGFLVCKPLEQAGFLHAFSTRSGGTSFMPNGDLNLAYRDDTAASVDENRQRFLSALGSKRPILTCRQTHSSRAHFVDEIYDSIASEPESDALATNRGDVFIGVKTADCVPVLLGDPSSRISVTIHAGWRGTVARVTQKTVERLVAKHGLNSKTAVVALGPSACAECYQVGPEVVEAFKKEFAYAGDLFQKSSPDGKAFVDVPQANVRQLLDAGVSPKNIYVSAACTIHQNKLFFSHRKEGKQTTYKVGRLLSVIGRS